MSPPPDTPRGFREYLPMPAPADQKPEPLGDIVRRWTQRWRVAPLVEKGAVLVERTSTIVRPRKLDYVVAKGESVAIDSPHAESDKELQRLADTTHAHWVMAFGADLEAAIPRSLEGFDHLTRIGYMLRERPNAAMLPKSVKSLQELVEVLRRWPDRPVGTVLLSSHGTPFSELMVPWKKLTPGSTVEATDYEDLEQVRDATIQWGQNRGQPNPDYLSLSVSGEVTLPRPLDSKGKAIPAALHLKGCQLGRHPEYLKKLKEALGPGIDEVTAPKFMQGVSRPREPSGFMEFFDYEFRLSRPKRLITKAEVVAAFKTENKFRTLDNKKVEPARWEEWVDRNPGKLKNHEQVRTGEVRVTTAIPRLPRATLHAYFMYEEVRMPNFTLQAPAVPNPEELKRLVRAYVSQVRPRWKDDHPFPMFRRMGYQTLAEWVEGFTWTAEPVDRNATPLTLSVNGVRHDYVVWTPVVDGTELFMNWYPDDKSQQPIIQLKESDTRFYGIA